MILNDWNLPIFNCISFNYKFNIYLFGSIAFAYQEAIEMYWDCVVDQSEQEL